MSKPTGRKRGRHRGSSRARSTVGFAYAGNKTREISFPLGGIGTGCIGLAGNGRLIDWEIFNRPAKGTVNGFSHFAIRAERGGKVIDARALQGDLTPPYTGSMTGPKFATFGFGPRSQTIAGLPHFRDVEFVGAFPTATLRFVDHTFPGIVSMLAFNPFIPDDDQRSGIPGAFFEIEVTNPTRHTIDYGVVAALANPLTAGSQLHEFDTDTGDTLHTRPGGSISIPLSPTDRDDAAHVMHLRCHSPTTDDPIVGDLALATDAPNVSYQHYWYRGNWSDTLEVYWRDLCTPGRLRDRTYPPDAAGQGNHTTLAAHVTLRPGASRRVRFAITWNFPTCHNYWDEEAPKRAAAAGVSPRWRNWYATQWADSRDSARFALRHWDELFADTCAFRDALFGSTLPAAAIDAISANLSILKSPTVMRLEDGTFYGWEGCHPDNGCCEGSCTHVWNYAQALPYLFPALERSMREADYRYNLRPDGGMPFRIQLPLGAGQSSFRPCADGHFGGVLKAYRDWKLCGDSAWIRRLWPAIKRSIEFATSPDNADRWDPEAKGVLSGRQHHTLDVELFGPNSWLAGLYLAALKAGAAIAEHVGEPDTAAQWRARFAAGKTWVDAHLFNGEYYQQQVDLADKSVVEHFAAPEYWSNEHGQLKYQIGDGCEIDQVVAQWHADLYGLGEIFDPRQTRAALSAIFRHNFIRPMRDFANTWRLFCLNDEGGLVVCTWPEGRTKPAIPLTYGPETMNGFEYAAAAHMITRGLVREGATVVEAVRERYDGERRNPWNEFECGSNYARSMASYALLNAYSGFAFDLARGLLGFRPAIPIGGEPFRCFWSVEGAWGEVILTRTRATLRVLYGALELREIRLPARVTRATFHGADVAVSNGDDRASLAAPVTIRRSEEIHFVLRPRAASAAHHVGEVHGGRKKRFNRRAR